ncbi:Formylglycine-generating enzyme, required for sulfatase activity, contains SUMF1/FGE domain [Nitrosomonas marina]|uniref:Formylglycine-generating enzyme, required for sulfatase activity, contains SUMF1/FGE domain n=1 Tax=Nitrosomonas marina TaxID=917 RepID=A0A1I0F5A4_9PROT|nr:SUMF1/EgtB/PvdO family nonheme iron enzyme [Nitrosomonas marina]SET52402.1 Formylglycine-generating enzyme, required for sulfatase activity, contains SUMF1/FGE domain [Nitrosomonas marina]
MSKIFLSHSSYNNAHALALACWLKENGWDDYFLDVDEPAKGLAPGERWQASLKHAAHRCEAVIFLISPAWRDSRWCQAEFLLAKQLGKAIFGVLVEATPLETLPKEMTAEWQLCDLVQGAKRCTYQVSHDPIVPQTEVSFADAGLTRLKIGLQRAGLDPASFPWPPHDDPKRVPYRGMKPLEAVDAAVFFGRDAAIVHGLDTLRAMQEQHIERMLVILGASGSGKSSFMRAGLWPRLMRDDLHFLPLPVIRPEHAVLNGPAGLIASLETAFNDLGQTKTRASIRTELQAPNGLMHLLNELQQLACTRISAAFSSTRESEKPVPTVVIAIDQAEELTSTEGRKESEPFLAMLAENLSLPESDQVTLERIKNRPLVIVTIRSDAYERLQTEPSLEDISPRLFDLPPISPKQYKTVIEGPATRATAAGHKLTVESKLTEQLLRDAEGADALPLLAFTLERLYVEYGSDGDLRLDEYNAMGGVRGSIEAVVEAAFAEPGRQPVVPAGKAERNALLHKAFVPWLAGVDPHTSERMRKIARWDELPPETHPLLERLIEVRLLLRDRCKLDYGMQESEAVEVVEVAHEALLRQWNMLSQWLDDDEIDLKALESVQRAASDWRKHGGTDTWLVHGGARLVAAERICARTDFNRLLGEAGSAYLTACRAKEDQLQRALKGTPEYDLKDLTQKWQKRTGLKRLFGLVGWWKLFRFRGLASPESLESTFLRWSRARASINALVLVLLIAFLTQVLIQSADWAKENDLTTEYALFKPLWVLGYTPKPELVEVPAGQFTMGCLEGRDDVAYRCGSDEKPVHEVTIPKPFLMGKHEVTFLEYDTFVWHMRQNGNKRKDGSEWLYPDDENWPDRLNRPVINVNWHDAQAYTRWLGQQTGQTCRLPTEAEWEYAARGGKATAYHWGSEFGNNNANCNNCGSDWDGDMTAPVGSFPANPYDLHDMSGNVWEWTCSGYSDELVKEIAQQCLQADSTKNRVLRGGSWYYDPNLMRASNRHNDHPVDRYYDIVFRVLCLSPIE